MSELVSRVSQSELRSEKTGKDSPHRENSLRSSEKRRVRGIGLSHTGEESIQYQVQWSAGVNAELRMWATWSQWLPTWGRQS